MGLSEDKLNTDSKTIDLNFKNLFHMHIDQPDSQEEEPVQQSKIFFLTLFNLIPLIINS